QILSNDKSKYKNPDLSYEKIPASLAWQLNLPLPKKYKLILATLSYSAHTSMVSYLLKCKLAISMHHSIDSKTNYIFNYEHILKETPLVINITGYMYSNLRFSQLHKLISLLNNKTTVLWLLRCPMQRLLSILKFCNRKPNLNYNLNEDTPLNILENRRIHGVDISKPLDERIKIATQTNSFAYIKLLGYFKSLGFKNWDFLDLSGIKDQQKILELFVKLSKTYSFETPKNKDDFSYEFIALHNGIIPLNFTVKGYKFKLHNQLLNELEISEALELKKTKLTSRIFIYAPDKNWQELDQSYLRKKIQALYDKLNEVLEDEASKAVSKEELMNLLRADTQTRRLLKEVFDKEVGFVKECAPEMVASWDYYNEFERICKELDGA
ncbi:DUF2972 domain-containing protein, partial [Campylobacter troglodytis]|uniref:DUF2972 domain-containing protein n=1 Tax=Campylobacter troglodytis TaxID=654363 RepID=UPI0011574576